MTAKRANERVFQGELFRIINAIIASNSDILFKKITQEEQVGNMGVSRFADGKLYSEKDANKIISFELKDANWDATDENLVKDAFMKASMNGYAYFVTGNPRQLVLFKTFEEGTPLLERKLKIYAISNIKHMNDVLLPAYESQIKTGLTAFLKDISDVLHNVKEIRWDSIDKFFVNKLSAYILEASASTVYPLYYKITHNAEYKKQLKQYLQNQDIFNVSLRFDYEDVYKISQLANYLLYLKLIFYSYIQRYVPKLELQPLEIPLDVKQLNKVLRKRFDKVLEWDYESIFTTTVLDDITIEESFLPVLQSHVAQLDHLDFTGLKADVIGSLYNTLIDNQEQHDRGQHFTNTDEVDIINGFCMNKDTLTVVDTACGAGTFLVRAYAFLKHFHPDKTHEQLLELLWGIEIAPFPVFLSAMNLCLLDIASIANYPMLINEDFSKVQRTNYYKMLFTNEQQLFSVKNLQDNEIAVKIPEFDACLGNPPYIRQELIHNKAEWIQLTRKEWGLQKMNQQSDLYVYYLMHTAAFLKQGKRLGYVIAGSWLDVGFGRDLQLFLLEHFKIIAIIENQHVRSFATASVNTIILIIEKCDDIAERENHSVKFVRFFKQYQEYIGNTDDEDRVDRVLNFVKSIETVQQTTQLEHMYIILKNQKILFEESCVNGKYENGNWGARYLRAPDIYNKIIQSAQTLKHRYKSSTHQDNTDDTLRVEERLPYLPNDNLIRLSKVVSIKRGFTTGANDFFYVKDHTEDAKSLTDEQFEMHFGFSKQNSTINWDKLGWYYSELTKRHYLLERYYTKPLFKTQKEANKLDVDVNTLTYSVMFCDAQKTKLSKFKNKIFKYIQDAEEKEIHKRPSCASRKPWYNLTNAAVSGDFIFPSKIGEKYRLIDNRNSKVFCDKVNYAIIVNEEFRDISNIVFLILNSILFRYFIDLFSRQLTGNQTLSDVDVQVVENTLIVNPYLLLPYKKELEQIYQSLKSREQGTIFQETQQADKKQLDTILLKVIGLQDEDVATLYKEASEFVQQRTAKSSSMQSSKAKQKLSYEDIINLVTERYPDITKYHELVSIVKHRKIKIENLKAIYPKDLFSENIFGVYQITFIDGNKSKHVSFDSLEQLRLFRFLHTDIDCKGQSILIPTEEHDCAEILRILQDDYNTYPEAIKSLVRSYRGKANHISIYRDIVMNTY